MAIEDSELQRREAAALADLSATALYHANRLPQQSRWGRLCRRLAQSLPQTPPPPPPVTPPGRHLRLIRGSS